MARVIALVSDTGQLKRYDPGKKKLLKTSNLPLNRAHRICSNNQTVAKEKTALNTNLPIGTSTNADKSKAIKTKIKADTIIRTCCYQRGQSQR